MAKIVVRMVHTAGLLIVAYFLHALVIGIGDRLETDTLASRILLGTLASDQAIKNHVEENQYGKDMSIFNVKLGVTVKMGIKRKSNIFGQVYDFLRLSGIISFS